MHRRSLVFHAGTAAAAAALPRRLASAAAPAAPLPSALPPEVMARRIDWFRDQKFGFFMHWGAYSVLGCTESWPLSWADRSWGNPAIKTKEEMIAFRRKYFDLPRTFNPTYFDPAVWARTAKRTGMKYMMFTTKHHDGFCMYDSHETDYRITHPSFPFAKDPRANVAREVFAAFRAQNFGIGCYFSKADWHSPHYWDPARWAEDRNPNYDTAVEPERWQKFVAFTHAQIDELMSGFGAIDILWIDAGQVGPPKQDIKMDQMVAQARKRQPGLLVVNRASKGLYEDYVTPEQEVLKDPSTAAQPWETCMTMGKSWSFVPDDTYKPTRELVHTLVDVVAKGGNLLLNVGPQPDGRLPAEANKRMDEIGDWMAVNAEAIHGTRPVVPYRAANVGFTANGKSTYALVLGEPVPSVLLPKFRPPPGTRATLLGSGTSVKMRVTSEGTLVELPGDVVRVPPCRHCHVFRFA